MTLRGTPIEERATLPDGRHVLVRVGVPDDPYIAKKELETVDVELRTDDDVIAAVNTILDPDQVGEGKALAREIAQGLESGQLEASAEAIERVANRLPSREESG